MPAFVSPALKPVTCFKEVRASGTPARVTDAARVEKKSMLAV